MEAKDLRIGNFFKYDERLQIVGGISNKNGGYRIDFKTESKSKLVENCKPLILDEEWLIELCFEENREGSGEYFLDDDSNFRNIIRIKKHPVNSGFMFVARDFILCTLTYVHELQNLYFSLATTELKRKEKK